MKTRKVKNFIICGTAERDLSFNTYCLYLGIDPDLKASGVALYSKYLKKLVYCTTFSFFQLYDLLKELRKTNNGGGHIIVHIEGAWLKSKSNWHTNKDNAFFTKTDKLIGEAIAKNVGNNHAIGQLIVEMCIHLDLSFLVREPITPRFKNNAELFKKATKYDMRTNADARSAADYVYGF